MHLIGDASHDSLVGAELVDLLEGLGASDTLVGAEGNDTLLGSGGSDSLIGGDGHDLVNGGKGTDTASYKDAAAGVVVSLAVVGAQDTQGAGTDSLISVEYLVGSQFGDSLTGSTGRNMLDGGDGEDLLSGGAGDDRLFGGDGDDTLAGNAGSDSLDGGAGFDTASFLDATFRVVVNAGSDARLYSEATGTVVSIDTLTDIEHVIGSNFNDHIAAGGITTGYKAEGAGGHDYLSDGEGDDTLMGGEGDDTLLAGAGHDEFDGGEGTDLGIFIVQDTSFVIDLEIAGPQAIGGGATVELHSVEDLYAGTVSGVVPGVGFYGDAGDNGLTGGNGKDTLAGRDGNDLLRGGGGDDTLRGGAGADTFNDSSGTNLLIGGNGIDTVIYGTLAVRVDLVTGITTYSGSSSRNTLETIENVTGSSASDRITGDDRANHLVGVGGSDTLIGGGAPDGEIDVLEGGLGNDRLESGVASYSAATAGVTADLAIMVSQNTVGAGTDLFVGITGLIGSSFADSLRGGTGDDLLDGGSGKDSLTGLQGADSIDGGGGSDDMKGGAGEDRLSGGGGGDSLLGGEGADVLTGADGIDHFIYAAVADSTDAQSDRIADLRAEDVVDLGAIDAEVAVGGNQSFQLVSSFGGHAGEMTVDYNAGTDLTLLRADTNGDSIEDLVIRIDGDATGFVDGWVL